MVDDCRDKNLGIKGRLSFEVDNGNVPGVSQRVSQTPCRAQLTQSGTQMLRSSDIQLVTLF
jgi:hypothetical protein